MAGYTFGVMATAEKFLTQCRLKWNISLQASHMSYKTILVFCCFFCNSKQTRQTGHSTSSQTLVLPFLEHQWLGSTLNVEIIRANNDCTD